MSEAIEDEEPVLIRPGICIIAISIATGNHERSYFEIGVEKRCAGLEDVEHYYVNGTEVSERVYELALQTASLEAS